MSGFRHAAVGAAVISGLAASASAGVRVVHASPDAPNVDVYVNGTPGVSSPAFSNLPFRSGSAYAPLATGNYNFKVTPAGAAAPVVIDVNQSINGSTDYSVVAINFLSSITALPLVDDRTINPSAARVRFVHASPDVPLVDVKVAGGATLFDAVAFGTSGGYQTVPGGTYDLEVRLDSNNGLALSVPGVSLQNGFVYTIFAMGSLRDNNVQAVPLVDIPSPGVGAAMAIAGIGFLSRRRR